MYDVVVKKFTFAISSPDEFLVAISGRRYSADNISSTTVTESACKAIEFGEITQNKGCYAVQGRSRSRIPMSVTIESPYATSY